MKTDVINILKTLIKETTNLVPLIDSKINIENITSHKDFYFSKSNEKLISLIFNYMRLDILNSKINLTDIEDIIKNNHNLTYIKKESFIDLVSVVLRPTIELYIELRIIKIFAEKNKERKTEAIEICCESSNEISKYELKKQILKNCEIFYQCKPKYLREFVDLHKQSIEEIRTSMSDRSILFFSNYQKKIEYILNNSNDYEKIILGRDYFTLYGFLSKRMHHSKDTYFTNLPFSEKHYVDWTILFFIEIFELIFWFYDKEFEISDNIDKQLQTLKQVNYLQCINNKFSINDIILVDFGVARIIKIDNNTVKIQYIYTNCLNVNDIDSVPITFIQKIDIEYYETIILKYSTRLKTSINELNKQLISNSIYEEFYLSLKENTNKS